VVKEEMGTKFPPKPGSSIKILDVLEKMISYEIVRVGVIEGR